MSQLREWAHSALAVIGVLLAMQGVITQYFTDSLGVQARVLTAVFGALGLLALLGSKYIDSSHDKAVKVALLSEPKAPVAVVPPSG